MTGISTAPTHPAHPAGLFLRLIPRIHPQGLWMNPSPRAGSPIKSPGVGSLWADDIAALVFARCRAEQPPELNDTHSTDGQHVAWGPKPLFKNVLRSSAWASPPTGATSLRGKMKDSFFPRRTTSGGDLAVCIRCGSFWDGLRSSLAGLAPGRRATRDRAGSHEHPTAGAGLS